MTATLKIEYFKEIIQQKNQFIYLNVTCIILYKSEVLDTRGNSVY